MATSRLDQVIRQIQATPKLTTRIVDIGSLYRIGAHASGEPYFSKSLNRFNDPVRAFGVCYFGTSLEVAFAETVLHNEVAQGGGFELEEEAITKKIVSQFSGGPLVVADLTGAPLKRLGYNADICSGADYTESQFLARAIYEHPDKVDGIWYVSRQTNSGHALALFDRAAAKFNSSTFTNLSEHSDCPKVLTQFGVTLLRAGK